MEDTATAAVGTVETETAVGTTAAVETSGTVVEATGAAVEADIELSATAAVVSDKPR